MVGGWRCRGRSYGEDEDDVVRMATRDGQP